MFRFAKNIMNNVREHIRTDRGVFILCGVLSFVALIIPCSFVNGTRLFY